MTLSSISHRQLPRPCLQPEPSASGAGLDDAAASLASPLRWGLLSNLKQEIKIEFIIFHSNSDFKILPSKTGVLPSESCSQLMAWPAQRCQVCRAFSHPKCLLHALCMVLLSWCALWLGLALRLPVKLSWPYSRVGGIFICTAEFLGLAVIQVNFIGCACWLRACRTL